MQRGRIFCPCEKSGEFDDIREMGNCARASQIWGVENSWCRPRICCFTLCLQMSSEANTDASPLGLLLSSAQSILCSNQLICTLVRRERLSELGLGGVHGLPLGIPSPLLTQAHHSSFSALTPALRWFTSQKIHLLQSKSHARDRLIDFRKFAINSPRHHLPGCA